VKSPSPSEITLVGYKHAQYLWYSLTRTFSNVTTIELAGTGSGIDREREIRSAYGQNISRNPDLFMSSNCEIKAVILE